MSIKDVKTYKKLIYEINELGSDADKMQGISEYILSNVKYNYLYSDNKIIDKYRAKFGDEEIFKDCEDLEDKAFVEKKLYNLCDKLGISSDYRSALNDSYENKIKDISQKKSHYEKKLKEISRKKIDDEEKSALMAIYENKLNEINEKFGFFDILPSMNFSTVGNGLLQKGTSSDIAEFVKKLCDDSNIPCEVVNTIENPNHVWNEVEIDGEKLNYDLTYAIFTRDALNDASENKQSDMDWIGNMGISEKVWLGFTSEDEIDLGLKYIKETVDDKYRTAVTNIEEMGR